MKKSLLFKIVTACVPLLFIACASKKVVTDNANANIGSSKTHKAETNAPTSMSAVSFIQKVMDNQVFSKNIVGDMNFNIKVGEKDLSVPGSIHMRRDEVIRLQLFIPLLGSEIGRLEFTPNYVLVVDRMHKEYVKADYNELSFLKNNGLNFYSMQALFWNELSLPGTNKLSDKDYGKYQVDFTAEGNTFPVSLKKGNMSYLWQADKQNGQITDASVLYQSNNHGSSDLTWNYSDFTAVGVKQFPANQHFKFNTTATTKRRSIEVNIKMKSVKTTEKWDTNTTVSEKYKKIQPTDVLGRLLGM